MKQLKEEKERKQTAKENKPAVNEVPVAKQEEPKPEASEEMKFEEEPAQQSVLKTGRSEIQLSEVISIDEGDFYELAEFTQQKYIQRMKSANSSHSIVDE